MSKEKEKTPAEKARDIALEFQRMGGSIGRFVLERVRSKPAIKPEVHPANLIYYTSPEEPPASEPSIPDTLRLRQPPELGWDYIPKEQPEEGLGDADRV